MSSRIDAVQDYLNRGWVPFAYGGQFTPGEGWQNSTVGPNTLMEVAGADTPIGLLLGTPSKTVVLDVDPRNGGDIKAVLEHFQIPQTRVHSTPSKGWHLIFKYHGSLKKTKGEKTGIPALKGVDLLANGSHILAPPTVRVNHPEGKPDGQYKVMLDVEPIELPENVESVWQDAIVTHLPDDVKAGELLSEESYGWALQIHRNNVSIAARADEGTRDDVCMARLGSSMRIALSLPDEVLSIDKVRDDFLEGVSYEIKDLDGKAKRAVEWAQDRAWTEPPRPEGSTLPEGVPVEMATEYFAALASLRVREAAKTTFNLERIEREARQVRFGEFMEGEKFHTNRPNNPRWLMKGLVPYGGSVLLAGQYKAGKSTLMLNLIKALTTATPFLGQFEVPNALKVAYVDLELGHSLAWDWFDEIPEVDFKRLVYVPRVGQGGQLYMQSETIRSKWARQLRQADVDVLIVDPLSPVMSALGIDENSTETVRPMLDAFDVLKVEAGLKSVIVTHHTGHQNTGRARGATAFMDWPAAFMSVSKQGEDENSPRSFRAFGRDVSVPMSSLIFDEPTRTLALSSSIYNPVVPSNNPF
jgi:AAA domain-containing protein/bifunctional DNA primase/polymerase-like protein